MSLKYGKTLRNGMALCLLAGLLTGCANSGDLMGSLNALNAGSNKYENAYLKKTIIPGKTTKNQVSQMFGAPTEEEVDATNSSNGSKWTYRKNQEGLDKYIKLAHKYVSTDTSLKIYDATAQASKAQEVANDVGSATGTKTAQNKTQGNVLLIHFVDDVVKSYWLY